MPTRTIDNDTVLEERLKSTSSGSQPLRVLQFAKGKGKSLEAFIEPCFTDSIPQKTDAWTAELVNPKASEDIFRGLHFPASDIPKQARDLYKINRIESYMIG
ncbi:hypothetical protein DID88_003759 [Monilinia fructigena]|uniref:Phytochrome chromophore attachment site domain-containing protein n=1 Tax=Monilinia fructigena TaxID=38457 RepID=A0A395ITZ9_9HELO|nr:hypothetical protein DID88_003759 [Monilinia fructigena]